MAYFIVMIAVVMWTSICVQGKIHGYEDDITTGMLGNNIETYNTTHSTIRQQDTAYIEPHCPELCECQRLTSNQLTSHCKRGYNDEGLTLHCKPGYNDEELSVYFKANPEITSLTFQNSNLTATPVSICNLPRLLCLDLAYNQIDDTRMERNTSCFQELRTLSLAYNCIAELDELSLEGFRNLVAINLKNNLISSIHRLTFLHSHLQNLHKIHLENNRLEYMDMWMFRMAAFIGRTPFICRFPITNVFVNLSSNSIDSFENTFNFTPSDVSLCQNMNIDLRRNKIRHIGYLMSIFKLKKWSDALGLWNSGFELHYNPFDCDCDMYDFLIFTRPAIKLYKENFYDHYLIQLHCETPLVAKGKLIYEVPDDVFRCYINESCPQGAECIHTPGNNTMTVRNMDPNVTSLPREVPKETSIQIIYPNTPINTLSERIYLPNVTAIDLGNTRLSNITAAAAQQLAQQVRHINFRQCQLSVLPEAFTSASTPYLQSVDLTGNPFQCDCHMRHMRKWLLDHDSAIIDLNFIICVNIPFRGKSITGIPAPQLICGYNYVFGAASVFFLLIIILILISIFFSLKRRIMMRLVNFFDKNFTLGSSSTPRELKYHVTMFVSDEDQDRVDGICEAIERSEDNFKVLRLGYLIGSPKLDITDKLPQSEGCLFFLSSEAVQDNRCIFCFRFAVDQFIRHYHRMFLIPVLLDSKETLIRTSKIPKDTKLFLQLFDSVDMSDGNTENFPQQLDEMTKIMKKQVEGFPHTLTTDGCRDIVDNNGANLPNDINATEDTVDTVYMIDLPSFDIDNGSDSVNIV